MDPAVPTLAQSYEENAAAYTRAAEQCDDPVFRNMLNSLALQWRLELAKAIGRLGPGDVLAVTESPAAKQGRRARWRAERPLLSEFAMLGIRCNPNSASRAFVQE